MTSQYLEDYAVGQIYWSGKKRVVKDEIVAFAKEFDPQYFHLDEVAALKSPFKGLAASGWHTAGMTMRLLVDGEFSPAGGILGVGFDELSNFGTAYNRFDEYDVSLVQEQKAARRACPAKTGKYR